MSLIAALALSGTLAASVFAADSCKCDQDGEHIVQINADSKFVAGSPHHQMLSPNLLRPLFKKISASGCKRIILYVHGGRISLDTATGDAKRLLPIIIADEPDAYPIFLCWDSEQFSSYFRHLAYERNGVSYKGSYAATTSLVAAPVVFTADVGRGVTRLPLNTTLSFGKLLQNADVVFGPESKLFPGKRKYEEQVGSLVKPIKPRDAIRNGFTYVKDRHRRDTLHIAAGHDAWHYEPKFTLLELSTLPFQFTTEPVLDIFGTPAWGNMVRRTRSMFHLAQNYVARPRGNPDYENAAGKQFFGALAQFLDDHSEVSLEIYAHSMGSIVINEAYATFPNLRANLIVYMAAACSIREFANTTGEYIAINKVPFYNLSLHPRAELDDTEALGLPVRGSLLVWIDEFFENPKSFGDRTLGNFENILVARDFLPQNAPIYLKAFAMEDKLRKKENLFRGPQRHGEFDSYHFWLPEFRCTDGLPDYYPRIPKHPKITNPDGRE